MSKVSNQWACVMTVMPRFFLGRSMYGLLIESFLWYIPNMCLLVCKCTPVCAVSALVALVSSKVKSWSLSMVRVKTSKSILQLMQIQLMLRFLLELKFLLEL